ncbi:MAG: ROK family protein [Akkermansiaceae bacterium]|nr:ROK family protein [Akkermansiaceae bacterium]MCP5542730.1 ROK family protein [Akkermansiaceae bacterium]MCP5548471.1 ROK family protein [Akkermansiaceae bacterium]
MPFSYDTRIVMTLDAGGTNFRFAAMRGGKPVTETVALPSNGDDLEACLGNLVNGFSQVRDLCPEPPLAISFAFPGPADYPNGIIGDLHNLPGFRGGVALGPMLEEKFRMPVYINNDGDLFTFGEALGGFLPHINGLLEKAGSPRRFRNLMGMTLGTGLGGGLVSHGRLLHGDNSMATEIWALRNRLDPEMNAEEGACIRAVRRVYADVAGIPFEETPQPKTIFDIADGKQEGNPAAAVEAFRRLGMVAGDALANSLAVADGLAVIGGGVSGAWPMFLPTLVDELNAGYQKPVGRERSRLPSVAFNLEDPEQLETFLLGDIRTIRVPHSERTVRYDPLQRVGVGISRLGTSEAVALGAYAYALDQLDGR